MFQIVLFIILLLVIWYFLRDKPDQLAHLPGPKGVPFFGNVLQIDHRRSRLTFHKWQQQYGDVYRIRMLGFNIIVVAGYEAIYDVLVTKGRQFSDRPHNFRSMYLMHNTGVVINSPDKSWRCLRKTMHQYFRPFADGIHQIEEVITLATREMISAFDQQKGQPFNPAQVVRRTAVKIASILIIGENLQDSDKLLGNLIKLEKELHDAFSTSRPSLTLVDVFPFILKLPFDVSRELTSLKQFMYKCWEDIKSRQTSTTKSLTHVLLKQLDQADSDEEGESSRVSPLTETDVRIASVGIIAASVATTSAVFTFLIYCLASKPDIQDRVWKEASGISAGRVSGDKATETISLEHKDRMPYTQALLFELLRYFTPAPSAVPHMTLEDTALLGYGPIPKRTLVFTSLWSLRHNKELWGDPDVFRPERFLDEDGMLLPADHPNRKYLLPFGAGPRVCVGEVFALARLFLWTTALVTNFNLKPADGNLSNWLDPTIHPEDAVLRPLPYEVIFTPRSKFTVNI